MDDRSFEELATEHLLGRLEGAEAADFETERARRGAAGEAVIRRRREALGALALAVPSQAPPPQLRDRVLAAVAREASPAVAREAPPAPLRPRARPWMAAAAILAAIAVGLAAWASTLLRDRARLHAELDAARSRLAAADSAAEAARRELAILAAPEARAVALAGTEHEPRARARVIVDPATGRALLYAYDLPILPEGAVYELWAIRGSTPQPAGTFVVDTAGRARFEVAGAAVLEGVDALAVTVEPAPGVPLPTGRMVLLSGS